MEKKIIILLIVLIILFTNKSNFVITADLFKNTTYNNIITDLNTIIKNINTNVLMIFNAVIGTPMDPGKTYMSALLKGLTTVTKYDTILLLSPYYSSKLKAYRSSGGKIAPPMPIAVLTIYTKPNKDDIIKFINTTLKNAINQLIDSIFVLMKNYSFPQGYVTNLNTFRQILTYKAYDQYAGGKLVCASGTPCDMKMFFSQYLNGVNISTAIGDIASAIWLTKNGYKMPGPSNIINIITLAVSPKCTVPVSVNNSCTSTLVTSQLGNTPYYNFITNLPKTTPVYDFTGVYPGVPSRYVKTTSYKLPNNGNYLLYNSTSNIPNYLEVLQGGIGDCVIDSAMAVIAYKNPDIIKKMIFQSPLDQFGIYYVVLYDTKLNPYIIRLNVEIPVDSTWEGAFDVLYVDKPTKYPVIWSQIILKAFSFGMKYNFNSNSGYNRIDEGFGIDILPMFIGRNPTMVYTYWPLPLNINDIKTQLNDSKYMFQGYSWNTNDFPKYNTMKNVSIVNNQAYVYYDSNNKVIATIIAQHGHSILGWDEKTQCIKIRNPWGTYCIVAGYNYPDGIMYVPPNVFNSAFQGLAYIGPSIPVPVKPPPPVNGGVLYQYPSGANFTVPSNVTSVCIVCIGAGGSNILDGTNSTVSYGNKVICGARGGADINGQFKMSWNINEGLPSVVTHLGAIKGGAGGYTGDGKTTSNGDSTAGAGSSVYGLPNNTNLNYGAGYLSSTGGGSLCYLNDYAVTPGSILNINVGKSVGSYKGQGGAVRIIWGKGRSFPNNSAKVDTEYTV